MRSTSRIVIACGLVLAATAPAAAQGTPPRTNPFFTASTLPFQAPRFDLITDADYQPALEEGMRQRLAEIEAIANRTDSPTFANTMLPLERAGALLDRVSKAFAGVTGANTDSVLQAVQTAEAPRLAAHNDAVYLNGALFRRVKSLYDRRARLGFTPEQRALVERYYRRFVRAGALLDEPGKERMRALNREESSLTTDFSNRLLAATKEAAVVVSDRAELDGLSEAQIAAAAAAAHERGLDGKWVLVLQNTTQQPLQAVLRNRALRQRIFEASTTRAERGGEHDTRQLIRRLAQLRAEKARLLGFSSYAAYALDDQMAKTPEAASRLLTQVALAANRRARSEAARMQQLIDQQHGGFRLAPWDWQFYAEQVRKAEYDLDEAQLRPYFELDRVLRDGVFLAANRLYGLTFRERHDIPVYHPDVRVFEAADADGRPLALLYFDYFKRDNKGGGAWMDNFVDQSGLMGTLPVVYNVANFQKPAAGQPALLSFDDVTTMFHEFGHALHGIFSRVQYPTLSGTNVPRDFVEFPSQLNEHWASDPVVFASYARHWQTGAPMPATLVERLKRARTFNQGFATSELVQAALLDQAWHALPATAPQQDVDAFEAQTLARLGVALAEVPPRYRTNYFAHIWGGGYAASYYAYLWSEVLDDDAFAWFTEHGGLTRANGQRFRQMILSRGSTADPGALYRAFRGRDPRVEPLLQQRGLGTPPGVR